MRAARIHRIVAVSIASSTFLLFLVLWILPGDLDGRNTDFLIWTVFSLVGALVSASLLALDLKCGDASRADWATWVAPLPYIVAGIISAFA